jgi:hypothetical protein
LKVTSNREVIILFGQTRLATELLYVFPILFVLIGLQHANFGLAKHTRQVKYKVIG